MTELQLLNKSYDKEDIMLADFMTWAKNTYPILRLRLFHIKNEGNRGGKYGMIDGMQNAAKGVLAGVPDVLCVHNGFWAIEFKLPDSKVSKEQQAIHIDWGKAQHPVYIVRNFIEWKTIINKILCNYSQ